MEPVRSRSPVLLIFAATVAVLIGGAAGQLLAVCGPFTDVTDPTFCPFVLEIFYLGITTGTTPTTYDPASSVSRLQMSAFLSRTVDAIRRGGRRTSLRTLWIPKNAGVLGLTSVGSGPDHLESDGVDIWVANHFDASVSRVRASDGALLQTWTAAQSARRPLIMMGRVLVLGETTPGKIYQIDPTGTPGVVSTVVSNLPNGPRGIAFDGELIYTANASVSGSVSIVTPGPTLPWPVSTVTAGFTTPFAAIYDGASVWVTDDSADKLFQIDPAGSIKGIVTVGTTPGSPGFDGANIWVPNSASNSITVVRASSAVVLDTLTGNGLNFPEEIAFDGERVLVTNEGGNSVSLWKAADLSPLGSFPTGTATSPRGACSDGVHFWITLNGVDQIARF
ncbi:MAG TPA: hypothetical protein VKG01_14285 [Thermoanaerobaculia bacterium]|nr:hypothetical protein [Thermoanaerobaculia bacterium]